MEFVANSVNGTYFRNILPGGDVEVDGVLAAIAYGGDGQGCDLVQNCVDNGWRLDIWMRYDHTVPVAVLLLQYMLDNHQNNVSCKLVPDRLHSKVIWWKGYGAYIGSANLTDRAWNSNIEAGIFLTEEELSSNGMGLELDSFFAWLKELEEAFPLTNEIVTEMEQLQNIRTEAKVDVLGKDLRSVPEWGGPVSVDRQAAVDRSKESLSRLGLGPFGKIRYPNRMPINWQFFDKLEANGYSWHINFMSINWRFTHDE